MNSEKISCFFASFNSRNFFWLNLRLKSLILQIFISWIQLAAKILSAMLDRNGCCGTTAHERVKHDVIGA